MMTGAPPSRANTPRSYDFAGPSSTNANGRPSSTYHGPSPLGATTDDPTVTTSRETHPPVDETNPAHKKRGFRAFRQRRQAQKATTTAAKVVTGLGKQLKQVALLGVYGKGPEIGSLSSARQLAKKLFANLEKGREGGEDGEAVLYVEDFLPVRSLVSQPLLLLDLLPPCARSERGLTESVCSIPPNSTSATRKTRQRRSSTLTRTATETSASARCEPPSKYVPCPFSTLYCLQLTTLTVNILILLHQQRIYKERKALTASLADMSSAISKLDGVLLVVALVICIFIVSFFGRLKLRRC